MPLSQTEFYDLTKRKKVKIPAKDISVVVMKNGAPALMATKDGCKLYKFIKHDDFEKMEAKFGCCKSVKKSKSCRKSPKKSIKKKSKSCRKSCRKSPKKSPKCNKSPTVEKLKKLLKKNGLKTTGKKSSLQSRLTRACVSY